MEKWRWREVDKVEIKMKTGRKFSKLKFGTKVLNRSGTLVWELGVANGKMI